jgi:hypothetical protein
MYSLLEISCMRQISKNIYIQLKSRDPHKQCCNSRLIIEHTIEKFVRFDEKKQPSLFRRARSDYLDALKLMILYEYLNDSFIFHDCEMQRVFESFIKSSKNYLLFHLLLTLKSKQKIRDIINHITAMDIVYFFNLNHQARNVNLLRYKLTAENIDYVFEMCKHENQAIYTLIPDCIQALHYALLVKKNLLF